MKTDKVLNHCAFVVPNLCVCAAFASVVVEKNPAVAARQRCLSLSGRTHKQRRTVVYASGLAGSHLDASHCAGGFSVSGTRWGSDPLSQYHANTNSRVCAHGSFFCAQHRLLVSLLRRMQKLTQSHTVQARNTRP